VAEPVSRMIPTREPIAPDPAVDREISIRKLMDEIERLDRLAIGKGIESEAAREDQRAYSRHAAKLRLDLARLIGE
jgi:hypothetical protein